MSWNLTCRKVRHSLALLSENGMESASDLDAAAQASVQRHVAVCPQCREQWQRLQAGQRALDQVRSIPRPLQASVWPSVARQLHSGVAQPEVAQPSIAGDWRGWLPTGALAAACLTFLLVIPPATGPQSPGSDSSVAGPAVVFPQAVGAPVWQLEELGGFDRAAFRNSSLPLSEVLRVRMLLDGTDVRGL